MSHQSPAVQLIGIITWANMLVAIWLRMYEPERVGWFGLSVFIFLAILMLAVNFSAPKPQKEEGRRW